MTEVYAPELPAGEVAGQGLEEEAWHTVRRQGIGGSDIAAILQLDGAYGTPVTVWESKVGEVEEQPENVFMKAGHKLEQPLADWFSEESGIETYQPPPITIYRSKELPIAQASPDRLAGSPASTTGWVEIKNAGAHKLGEWEEGAPLYYLIQARWQLFVSGLPVCWLAALIGGTRFERYAIYPTEAQKEALFELAQDFWDRYVVTRSVPPVTESEKTRQALMKMFRKTVPEPVEGGDELAEWLRAYQKANAEKAAAEKAAKLASNHIAAILQEHEVGLVNGVAACRWPSIARRGYSVPSGTYRKLFVEPGWDS